jgi:hypothetical protein
VIGVEEVEDELAIKGEARGVEGGHMAPSTLKFFPYPVQIFFFQTFVAHPQSLAKGIYIR